MKLLNGDCLDVLKTLEDNSLDSLVTDPPAGISFMGKDWDHDKGGRTEWVKWMASVMMECLRVMKPGAHGLVWALPRTSHWTATALEDAGFEVRDVITHLFGSGFPKSLDISKAIDKAAGAQREVLGIDPVRASKLINQTGTVTDARGYKKRGQSIEITAPATEAAKTWQGWGTALKPASEHWILVRKPLGEKTVAANVLKYGTGGINIDGCRVPSESMPKPCTNQNIKSGSYASDNSERDRDTHYNPNTQGRFPANLVLDEEAAALLDEQSGYLHASGNKKISKAGRTDKSMFGIGSVDGRASDYKDGGGGASRFFYVAKASRADKNNGLEVGGEGRAVGNRPNSGDMTGKFPDHDQRPRVGNHHPTVKSTALMSYLIKLVTPPGGIVLDPFMGSGSTGVSAKRQGFDFIGIERDAEYFKIATERVSSAE